MKNIDLSINPTALKQSFFAFLHRFHIVLFVVMALGSLAVAILLLNNIIARSSQAGSYTPQTNSANFDQATIKRIEELKTSQQSGGDIDFSKGRTNPFVE